MPRKVNALTATGWTLLMRNDADLMMLQVMSVVPKDKGGSLP